MSGTGIDCGADCSESYADGTVVNLTASPARARPSAGWSGACTGTGTCSVPMDAAKSVTATFTLVTHSLLITKAGNGSGTVSGTGIDCGPDCSERYPEGTSVTLNATPAAGSTFAGWSGACTNATGPCTVTMDAAKALTALFNLAVTPPPPPPPIDTVAPNTTIKSGPPRTTRSRTAKLVFSSTETGSRFQCKLDKGAWKACASPKTYKKLKKAKHTFLVRAIDAAGNVDLTPAKRAWRIR